MEYIMVRNFLVALVFGSTVLAFAPTAEASERIRIGNVRGYSVIDEQHVVINSGARRHYLATLRRRCPGLSWGMSIGTSFGRHAVVTNPRHEFVTPTDRHHGNRRCYLETLEEVESLDAARELIAARAAASEDTSED
jgi:hypothetical protein